MFLLLSFLTCMLSGRADAADQGLLFEGYERSLAMAREELALRPDEPRLLHVLARVHYRSGRFRRAVEAFGEVVRIDPKNGEGLIGLGFARLRLQELEAAEAAFQRALAVEGVRGEARRALVDLYLDQARYGDAAKHLRAFVEEGGSSGEIHYRLGLALEGEARLLASREGEVTDAVRDLEDEALRHLESAVALAPRQEQAHYVLGRLLVRRGDVARGREILERFRRLRRQTEPQGVDEEKLAESGKEFEARTALEIARALLDLGDDGRALQRVSLALERLPRMEDALALRGRIRLREGRSAAALEDYEAILARDPGHVEALWQSAKLRRELGDGRRAADYLLRAIERRPGFAQAWEVLFDLASAEGVYPERAEEFARKALRARPSARNHSRLAVFLFEAGKLEESEKVLRAGLERYPGDEEISLGLRALLEAKKAGR